MELTVLFTDVYDGEEHPRTETFDVPAPPRRAELGSEELDEWAEEHLFPRTGDGNAVDKKAGYYADITACPERPALVGAEFSWGV